jgi:hypothetical protein
MAPGAPRGPAFVRDWSGGRIVIGANQIDPGVVRRPPHPRQNQHKAKPTTEIALSSIDQVRNVSRVLVPR